MKLRLSDLKDPLWKAKEFEMPKHNVGEIKANTLQNPRWIHFGAGNIFRAFPAAIMQDLLNRKKTDTGLIVCEGFDYEIIDLIYRPHDDLAINVTLKADGTLQKKVIASVVKSLTMDRNRSVDWDRLKKIFTSPSLQMASFTITEKGYGIFDGTGKLKAETLRDINQGPDKATSYMGKITALCHERYLVGAMPIALVSLDNFSHNGDKLKKTIETYAREWMERGYVSQGFLEYLLDPKRVSFPWSMIDKITPRPDAKVGEILKAAGVKNVDPIITKKHTYIAPYVNAEETQYLVIEDHFPNGRPPLEDAGIIITRRDVVHKVEQMKVCTCLNPLHTALAVYGCLLGYEYIYEEMNDNELRKMVETIGYVEGLPVVIDPGIIQPKEFINEVLEKRFPNPYIPDTPQRIATDTSQKLSARFGETIKAYINTSKDLENLNVIPLVFAGWIRYLLGVNDEGESFTVSADPMYDELYSYIKDITLGMETDFKPLLKPILTNSEIFGINLWDTCLAAKVIDYFSEMCRGKGAVRRTLKTYLK